MNIRIVAQVADDLNHLDNWSSAQIEALKKMGISFQFHSDSLDLIRSSEKIDLLIVDYYAREGQVELCRELHPEARIAYLKGCYNLSRDDVNGPGEGFDYVFHSLAGYHSYPLPIIAEILVGVGLISQEEVEKTKKI